MKRPPASYVAGTVRLCDKTIELAGQSFTPDLAKSYLLVEFAFCPPSVTAHGESLWPGTVARCFRTMLHQQVNIGHLLKAYDPAVDDDRMIGMVVAVDYPVEPAGGWILPEKIEDAPRVRAVISLSKMVDGVAKILVETGHGIWSVSMEVNNKRGDAAWIWRATEGTVDNPDVIEVKHGWLAIPAAKAPDDLIACYDPEVMAVTKTWKGKRVVRLMGGFDGDIHFFGLGLVKYPAEEAAGIRTVLASQSRATIELRLLNERLNTALSGIQK